MSVETLRVKSSELRKDDVVLLHGMRILIDREIKSGPGAYGDVFHTAGLVTNLEELIEDGTIGDPSDDCYPLIPRSWLYPNVFRGGWTKDYSADPRWDIQGNDLASWTVERES